MPTTDGMIQAFEMLTVMGLRPPGDNPGLALRLWLRLFDGTSDRLMATAVEAHLCDPKRGQWWPKPADINHQLAQLRSEHSPLDQFGYQRRPELEVVGGTAAQIIDHEAVEKAREEKRKQSEWKAEREAEQEAERVRLLAYGERYGPRLVRLRLLPLDQLQALGSCAAPVDAHAEWHECSGMHPGDLCPYEQARQMGERRGGAVLGEGLADVLQGIASGGAA